jgi:hypothetical protein
MKKINLTIKNHFKDVIQKEKREKLIKSFLFNNKTKIDNNKKFEYEKTNNYDSFSSQPLLSERLYNSFHNEEIKKKISNVFLSFSNKNIRKKRFIISYDDENEYSHKDYSLLLISKNLKNKILSESQKNIFNHSNSKKSNNNLFSNRNKFKKKICFNNNIQLENFSILKDTNLKKINSQKKFQLINNQDSIIPYLIQTVKDIKEQYKDYKGRFTLKDKMRHIREINQIKNPIYKKIFLLKKDMNKNNDIKILKKKY